MAYTKPTLYTPDWKRIRNMINGYQSGYRPVSRPRGYSIYNYDASLMPAETLPIPEEEYVPPVESAPLPQGETSLDSLVYDNDKSLDKFKGGNTGGGMSKNPMSYLQAAGDLASMGMDIYNSSKSQVALPAYTNYHAGNVNSMAGYNMMRQGPMLSHNLAHKQTAGEVVGDTLTKTAKGALDGLSVGGPWGALAGAVIGLGMGIGNAATKGATYRKDIAKINYFNDVQRDNYRRAQRQALGNIQAQRNMGINYQRHMNTYGLGGTVEPSELMQVTKFNTGGTHEGNPYGGVPIGIGENGKPNLVEEGEVRWKDFIFSKRVKPTDEVLKKYNTYMKGGFESYADLANKILELHKEREDSPFDKAAMNTQMQRLADAQEWQKLANEAAQYGLTPEQYQQYQQEAQQYQQGTQFAKGGWVPTDYSGDEWKNYLEALKDDDIVAAFADWYNKNNPGSKLNLQSARNNLTDHKRGPITNAFLDYVKSRQAAAAPLPPIQPLTMSSDNTITPIESVAITKPEIKRASFPQQEIDRYKQDRDNGNYNPSYPYYADLMRMAPIFENIRSIVEQDAPDYTYANQIASTYRPMSYRPVGQYQRYMPIDQHYLDTMANHQRNTMYGLYRNNAQSNNAADYYATMAATLGRSQAYEANRNAVMQNNQQRNAAIQYNNQLDAANEAARANIQAANAQNYANIMGRAYAAQEEERRAVELARETNLNRLAQNIGNLGNEMYDKWRVDSNPAYSYDTRWRYTGRIPWSFDDILAAYMSQGKR